MIPILYDRYETNFTSGGIGRLSDCISCTVTEERNGIYECELVYPITGAYYSAIEHGLIIYATHDDTEDPEPFEIYSSSKPIDGKVTFYAHHISYRLNSIVVEPFTATSCAEALLGIKNNSINDNPFTFWTDKETVGPYSSEVPKEARALLGGEENSILDVYGKGDYEWDHYTVKLHANRGSDTQVEIRYGKNLVDLTDEVDSGSLFDGVVPYWITTDEDEQIVLSMLPEKAVIYNGNSASDYLATEQMVLEQTEDSEYIEVDDDIGEDNLQVVPLDLSDLFEEEPTEAQLRAAALSYLENAQGWIPVENIEVDFVQLWQTEEYAEYAPLQRVRLCDTVSVYYPELGVNKVRQKVVKTVYNVLLDRYDSIELGSLQTTLGDAIAQSIDTSDFVTDADMKKIRSGLETAISDATQKITGGLGGYVYMKPNANGYPEEILIMNTQDYTTATKIWRWNLNGLGYSNTGYSGTYGTAITMDGEIVADYITTGTLNANIIKAGVLQDANGNTSLNMSTGALTMQKGSIDLGSGAFTADDNGNVVLTKGKIGKWDLTASGLELNETSPVPINVLYGWHDLSLAGNGNTFEASINGASFKTTGETNNNLFSTTKNTGYLKTKDGSGITIDSANQSVTVESPHIEVDLDSTGFGITRKSNSATFFESSSTTTTLSAPTATQNASVTVTQGVAKLTSAAGEFRVTANGAAMDAGRTSTAHSGNVYVATDGALYRANEGSSSRKIKRNIEPIRDETLLPDRLYDAEIIQFIYKDDELDQSDPNKGKTLPGFIVEDLDKIYPAAVQKEAKDSKTWTWSPYRMIPPMLKLIQDQKKEIDELREKLDSIETRIAALEEKRGENTTWLSKRKICHLE